MICLSSTSRDVGVPLSAFGHCSENLTAIKLAGMIRSRNSRVEGPLVFYLASFSSSIFVLMFQVWLPGKWLCFRLAPFLISRSLLIRNSHLEKLNWFLKKISSSFHSGSFWAEEWRFKQDISYLSYSTKIPIQAEFTLSESIVLCRLKNEL